MMRSKMMPWHMANMRKIAVANLTLGLLWSKTYWEVWSEVMFGKD